MFFLMLLYLDIHADPTSAFGVYSEGRHSEGILYLGGLTALQKLLNMISGEIK